MREAQGRVGFIAFTRGNHTLRLVGPEIRSEFATGIVWFKSCSCMSVKNMHSRFRPMCRRRCVSGGIFAEVWSNCIIFEIMDNMSICNVPSTFSYDSYIQSAFLRYMKDKNFADFYKAFVQLLVFRY